MLIQTTISKFLKQAFGSQLRRNVSSGMATAGVNMGVLAISYPLYLHFLGYEKYGLWLILATVLGFAQLGRLGVSSAVMKLVAEEYERDNIRGAQSYVAMALMILTVTGTTMLVVILLFKAQIVAVFRLDNKNAELVSWLLPYIGLLSIYVFFVHTLTATISGLGRMDLSNYAQTAGRITAVGISVLLLCFGYGVASLLIGNTLSYVIVHIVSLVFIRCQAKVRFLRLDNWNWQRLKKLLSFGSGVFGGALVNMLLDPFNKLMLSRYAGVAFVPVYEISYKGAMMIKGLISAGLQAMMPEISRIGADMTFHAKVRIAAINRQATKFILVSAVPILGGLFIFAAVLLRVWLRDSFVDVLPRAFRIMLIASFVGLLGVPAYFALMGLGKVGHIFMCHCIASVTSSLILVTTVLINSALQVSTVAYALLVGTALSAVYLLWQLHRSMQNLHLV